MNKPQVSISASDPEAITELVDVQSTYKLIGTALSMQHVANPLGIELIVASYSKANPGVVTVNGHGLLDDNIVIVVDGSGSWAAVNGNRIITRIDANSFSIAINTTAFTGTFAGKIYTRAPQTSKAIWSIKKQYISSSNIIRTSYANGNAAQDKIWDNRASYGYN